MRPRQLGTRRRFLSPFYILAVILSCLPSATANTGAVICGKVVDQKTNEPLRKVRVTLQGAGLQSITDDAGAYRHEGIEAGDYTLYVLAIGYRLNKRYIQISERESKADHKPSAFRISPSLVILIDHGRSAARTS